jgi:mannose-6-phosphate isomerase-like protein (cupin superfamily)
VKTKRDAIEVYVTRDGSTIRELMHPAVHGCRNLSLAEAEVAPGGSTALHIHYAAEEIYHILQGSGIMTLGEERFEVGPGDTIRIPPNRPHRVVNIGTGGLKILCCCAPAYSHDDTELLG